jgi:alginate O-acetyltransferase complex protein AlgI
VTSTVLHQLFSEKAMSVSGATPLYWSLLAISAGWCLLDSKRRIQGWMVERMPYALTSVPIALSFVALQLFGQFGLQIPFIYFKF